MGTYKHIETCVGEYIAQHYADAIEIGIGHNMDTAKVLHDAGITLRSTDIKDLPVPDWLTFRNDDIFSPFLPFYAGAGVIYAIRPAIEMIPPLISLAREINSDLLVYHLGFESYGNDGERIDCGVILHRYVTRSEPVEEG